MKNFYSIKDGIVTIYMEYKDQLWMTEISESKLEKAKKCVGHWGVFKKKQGTYYVSGNVKDENGKYRTVLLHRWIMDEPKGLCIDHIDRDGFNNTDENLRVVTNAENLRNRRVRSDSKSGVLGVWYNKPSKKWIAQITVNGKKTHLGVFETLEEARKARIEAEKKYFGEFAPSFRHNAS